MRLLRALSVLLVFFAASACSEDKSGSAAAEKQGQAPAPAVVVAPVTSKSVSNSLEFVGQTEAYQKVELRARVTGVLTEKNFKDGAQVKADQLLFVIDPAEFQAAHDAAAAKVERSKATILEAKQKLERYKILVERGTAAQASLDQATATEGEATADLAAAQADLERAKLDLGYTKISAPITGQIGSSAIDVGNLIGPDTGVLATLIAMDPIRVIFSISEQDFLDYKQAKKNGDAEKFTPRIKLANDTVYPHDGTWDFVDNQVDPSTGTIGVRVEFPNTDGLILPGLFVNVNLVSADPKDQLVVAQAAVQENQTGPFVLVVDNENRVEVRPIKTGQRAGTDIVVTDGLTKGEMIVIEGIQKVRPGGLVDPVRQDQKASG
jgi:membrane fusion protein (multidrug efflux system)